MAPINLHHSQINQNQQQHGSSLSHVEAAAAASTLRQVKHKRRYCRVPGCTKIVKSQGLCQSHGAKPRKCKVDGCQKQAQVSLLPLLFRESQLQS